MIVVIHIRALGIYAFLHVANMIPESKFQLFFIMLLLNIPFGYIEVMWLWPRLREMLGEVKKEESYMHKLRKELNLPEDW
jgi:hypothetical protein